MQAAGGVGCVRAAVVDRGGRGLLVGIGLSQPLAQETARIALDEGILVNPIGGRTIRIAPALTIGEEEVALAVAGMGRALARAQQAGAGI